MTDDTSKPRVPLIAVVDDDESVRESLPSLLRSCRLRVCAFASARDFLSSTAGARANCLVLDIGMPGMSGVELQDELKARRVEIPIVFITARADGDERERLIRKGAVDCLFKPFSPEALLLAVDAALSIRSSNGVDSDSIA